MREQEMLHQARDSCRLAQVLVDGGQLEPGVAERIVAGLSAAFRSLSVVLLCLSLFV